MAAGWTYASLGDSLSTDDYTGVEGGGAASLLFQNRAELWPEWDGKDLSSHFPDARHWDLAANGVSLEDVRKGQVRELAASKDRKQVKLVTVAAGMVDIARQLTAISPDTGWIDEPRLKRVIEHQIAESAGILKELREALPDGTPILLTSNFNPNHALGGKVDAWKEWAGLEGFINEIHVGMQAACDNHDATFVDLFARFRAHSKGKTKKQPLLINIVELNAEGAHTLRELWWDTLPTVGVRPQ